MTQLALTELLGATVFDSAGKSSGRVREVALTPQEDRVRISTLIVRTRSGDRLLPFQAITGINGGIRTSTPSTDWTPANGTHGRAQLESRLLRSTENFIKERS